MIALVLPVARLLLQEIATELNNMELKIIYTDKLCKGETYQKERNIYKGHQWTGES